MKYLISVYILISIFAVQANTEVFEIDSKETVDGVSMQTGKHEKVRMYEAQNIQEYAAPIKQVVDTILEFEGRCNNEFTDKRKIVAKSFKCKHFNKSIVETVRVTDIKNKKLDKNEVDRFLLKRFIYNRNAFRHNELVRVFKFKNEKKQVVYKITQEMLSNKESKKYMDDPMDKESAFIKTEGVFLITALGPNRTEFNYKYTSKTDHWLLNKSMVVSEFFENMSKGVNSLFQAIQKDVTHTALNSSLKK